MSDITVVSLDGPAVTVVNGDSINVVEASVGLQGPPGPRGFTGAPGVSPAGADLHATHVQASAADLWLVAHNLGKRPSVTVVDSAGDPVEGMVSYTDSSNLTITFSAAFSGEAYLN